MNRIDIETGFWVSSAPYYFTETKTVKTSKRNYLRSFDEFDDIKKCSNPLINNYFSVSASKTKKQAKFLEGRNYYDKKVLFKTPFEVIIPQNNPNPLSLELEKYKDKYFSLFSLICSQMANFGNAKWLDILNILKNCPLVEVCDPCTDIGAKIAKSLIKIASLRIFADPEQSIMELPVNSLDAYTPESKIGKFGDGLLFHFLLACWSSQKIFNSSKLL